MSEIERARKELELAGLFDKGEDSLYDGMIGEAVMELMDKFSEQGHSGMSASIVSRIFYNLVRGDVLSPLTGEPGEWGDISRYGGDFSTSFQNIRDSRVFAEDDHGKNASFIEGIVFTEKSGSSFTCRESHTPITFPCIPKTIYIKEGTPEAEAYAEVFKRVSE